MFDEEEWASSRCSSSTRRELEEERERAAKEGRDPRLQPLLDKWGGVSLVYRKLACSSRPRTA